MLSLEFSHPTFPLLPLASLKRVCAPLPLILSTLLPLLPLCYHPHRLRVILSSVPDADTDSDADHDRIPTYIPPAHTRPNLAVHAHVRRRNSPRASPRFHPSSYSPHRLVFSLLIPVLHSRMHCTRSQSLQPALPTIFRFPLSAASARRLIQIPLSPSCSWMCFNRMG
jgi:hypothetical protein